MGLFSRKKRTDIASMICGYCRMEVQKITGIDPNSSKYDDFIRSIQQSIKPVFDILENAPDTDSTKKILTGIAQTLNGVPGNSSGPQKLDSDLSASQCYAAILSAV